MSLFCSGSQAGLKLSVFLLGLQGCVTMPNGQTAFCIYLNPGKSDSSENFVSTSPDALKLSLRHSES